MVERVSKLDLLRNRQLFDDWVFYSIRPRSLQTVISWSTKPGPWIHLEPNDHFKDPFNTRLLEEGMLQVVKLEAQPIKIGPWDGNFVFAVYESSIPGEWPEENVPVPHLTPEERKDIETEMRFQKLEKTEADRIKRQRALSEQYQRAMRQQRQMNNRILGGGTFGGY